MLSTSLSPSYTAIDCSFHLLSCIIVCVCVSFCSSYCRVLMRCHTSIDIGQLNQHLHSLELLLLRRVFCIDFIYDINIFFRAHSFHVKNVSCERARMSLFAVLIPLVRASWLLIGACGAPLVKDCCFVSLFFSIMMIFIQVYYHAPRKKCREREREREKAS